jgi:hypothetical protein
VGEREWGQEREQEQKRARELDWELDWGWEREQESKYPLQHMEGEQQLQPLLVYGLALQRVVQRLVPPVQQLELLPR